MVFDGAEDMIMNLWHYVTILKIFSSNIRFVAPSSMEKQKQLESFDRDPDWPEFKTACNSN